MAVAVGTPVTGRPPRRSVQAPFPHTALTYRNAGAVAHQPAGCRELTPFIDCGYRVACCQCDNFLAAAIEERVGGYGDSTGSLLHDNLEGCVEVTFGAGVQHIELEPESARGLAQVFQLSLGDDVRRVQKHGNRCLTAAMIP